METNGRTVYGRVATPRPARNTPPSDDLLPSRTRFRVFRAATEGLEPSPAPIAPAPGAPVERPPRRARRQPPATEAEVAEILASARVAAAITPPLPAAPAPAPGTEPQPSAAPARAAQPGTPPVALQIAVIGAPFRSFLALNEFQGAVRALPGARDTRVRRFYNGTLNLSVDYEDAVPFAERLRTASDGGWTVTTAPPDRVEIRVSEPGSSARSRFR